MTAYTDLPIPVLFGDYVEEFPRWAPRLKNCRAFVTAANAAGGKAELLVLPEIGNQGLHAYADAGRQQPRHCRYLLLDWIDKHVTVSTR